MSSVLSVALAPRSLMLIMLKVVTVAPKPRVPLPTAEVLQSPATVGAASVPPLPTNTPTLVRVRVMASASCAALRRAELLIWPSPIWNPPLATSTPFSTFKATPPDALRSTPAPRGPRLVPFNAAFSAVKSMPVVVSAVQSSLFAEATAEPRATLLSRPSTL